MNPKGSQAFYLLEIPLTEATCLGILEHLVLLQSPINSATVNEAEAGAGEFGLAIHSAFHSIRADVDARNRDASKGVVVQRGRLAGHPTTVPSCLHNSGTSCQESTCSFTRTGSSNGSTGLSVSLHVPAFRSATAHFGSGSFVVDFRSLAFLLTGRSGIVWKPCLSLPARLRGSALADCEGIRCSCQIIPKYVADRQGEAQWLVNRYVDADSLRNNHDVCVGRWVANIGVRLYPVLLTTPGDNPQRPPLLGGVSA
ncbi:hypothetical protein BKA70DRAFT_1222849 [Coprinopsis sp. MPI-PUGE-AT-0042]|nr:hypothetical protein BKA70DRAFT_1222849 [Coprinopsis sp. MPI-PUGE-AT-0042]